MKDNPSLINELWNRKGYLAKRRGQILDIHECVPVTAHIRSDSYCKADLPVLFNGTKYYRDSLSHIIKQTSPSVPCEEYSIHEIQGKFFGQGPKYFFVKSPENLSANLTSSIALLDLHPYKVGSIYGNRANDFTKAVMFSIEEETYEKTLSAGVMTSMNKELGFGNDNFELDVLDIWSGFKMKMMSFFEDFLKVAGVFSLVILLFNPIWHIIIGLFSLLWTMCTKGLNSKETKQIFRNIFNYFKQKLLGAFIFFGLYTENNEPVIEMGIVNVMVDVENDEEME